MPDLLLGIFVVRHGKNLQNQKAFRSTFPMNTHPLWHPSTLTGFSQSKGYRNTICSLLSGLGWKSVEAVANLQLMHEVNGHFFFTAVARGNA